VEPQVWQHRLHQALGQVGTCNAQAQDGVRQNIS
jgi:hypothetical protein